MTIVPEEEERNMEELTEGFEYQVMRSSKDGSMQSSSLDQLAGTLRLTHTDTDTHDGGESPQPRCKFRACRAFVVQQRGHRFREYCDDTCKQAEYRLRKQDRERAEELERQQAQKQRELAAIRATYRGDLDEQTYHFLWQVWKRSGDVFTEQVAKVIAHERDRQQQHIEQLRQEITLLAQELGEQDAAISINELAQARIEDLETELARYQKLADLDSRTVLCEQWMLIGEKLGYRPLILFKVRAGADDWSAFADRADEEYLAQAIATANRFFEDLRFVYRQP